MLGSAVITALQKEFDPYGMVRSDDRRSHYFQCDITQRSETIKHIERVNPQAVIHCAAMTDVDACEHDRQRALQVNFEGTKNVVDGSRHVNALMIYISTDFVFNGESREAYRESSIPHPINVYGESKLMGEFYVRDQSTKHLILRTSWLFGENGNNFMVKVLERAKRGEKLFIVHDQVGTPTYASDLAGAIKHVLTYNQDGDKKEGLNAVYHATNRGTASRYDIAKTLLKMCDLTQVEIQPIDSTELTNLAKRPQNSALNNSRFEQTFRLAFRSWQEALQEYVIRLGYKHAKTFHNT